MCRPTTTHHSVYACRSHARWLEEAKTFANPNICITLVGNKTDVASRRVVSREEAVAFAEKNGLKYVETSAKTAAGVDETFMGTASDIWWGFYRYYRSS